MLILRSLLLHEAYHSLQKTSYSVSKLPEEFQSLRIDDSTRFKVTRVVGGKVFGNVVDLNGNTLQQDLPAFNGFNEICIEYMASRASDRMGLPYVASGGYQKESLEWLLTKYGISDVEFEKAYFQDGLISILELFIREITPDNRKLVAAINGFDDIGAGAATWEQYQPWFEQNF